MKKLFFLLLPLLAAAWLASLGGCGKCKGIEGKVLEFGTDKPIPNATVTLADCEGEILGNFSCTDLAYATTNSDGRFDFSEDGFAVSAKAPGYWDTGDDFIMSLMNARNRFCICTHMLGFRSGSKMKAVHTSLDMATISFFNCLLGRILFLRSFPEGILTKSLYTIFRKRRLIQLELH